MENIRLQVFSCMEKQVRILDIDGKPWFVGKDVCNFFGDTNPSRSLGRLDDDERTSFEMETNGGKQKIIIINESGLYHLLFKFTPERANNGGTHKLPLVIEERIEKIEKFKKWITKEVLPSIRKHGIYATPITLQDMIDDPDYAISLLSQLKEKQPLPIV